MPQQYIPRLTDAGMMNNPYWYSLNPLYQAGYGLPNCTCYAWGRFWEIGDPNRIYEHRPELSTLNAEYWYGHADSYSRGQTPALGAVICFADGPFSGEGHVAIVEEIHADGSITVSDSAYDGWYFDTHVFYPPNYLPQAGYVFQGFIYNPYSGGGPSPGPNRKKIWYFKRKLWRVEKELIT